MNRLTSAAITSAATCRAVSSVEISDKRGGIKLIQRYSTNSLNTWRVLVMSLCSLVVIMNTLRFLSRGDLFENL